MSIRNSEYLKSFNKYFPELDEIPAWQVTSSLQELLKSYIKKLPADYIIDGEYAVHKSATVEAHVIIKGPVIIGPGCFVGSHAYLRGGVFLGESVSIGPGCEIKTSIILDHSALAHFNFAGDSIIGSSVNMEAGSILANYHNDREDKTINMIVPGEKITLNVTKFGALIGDHVKIGANAVCSPGTFLRDHTIVKRLALIEQDA